MRAFLKTVMTGSVLGAALLVSACGGAEETEVVDPAADVVAVDPLMDGATNDVTAVDGAAMDANMMMGDTNMMMDANMSNDMMMNNMMDANMSNGM